MSGYYYAAGYKQRSHKAFLYFPRGFRIRPADFRDSVEEQEPTFYNHPVSTTWDDGVWDLYHRVQHLKQLGPKEELEVMETLIRLMPRPDVFFADQMNNPHLSYQHYYFLRDISRLLSGIMAEDDRPSMDPRSWLPLLEDRTNYEPGFKGAAPTTAGAKPSPGAVGEFYQNPFQLNPHSGEPLPTMPSTARWLRYDWSFPWTVDMLYVLFGPLSTSNANA